MSIQCAHGFWAVNQLNYFSRITNTQITVKYMANTNLISASGTKSKEILAISALRGAAFYDATVEREMWYS